MSRKARLAVYRDRLEAISDCPSSILNSFEPSDTDFEIIAKAETGDVGALKELTAKLYNIYGEQRDVNEALLYFLKRGLEREIPECAALFIKCIDKYNLYFDLLEDAVNTVNGTEEEKEVGDVTERASLKRIISSTSPECSFSDLREALEKIDTPHRDAVYLYLEAKRLEYKGENDEYGVRNALRGIGAESLALLPTFTARPVTDGNLASETIQSDTEALKKMLSTFDIGEWQDLWLSVIYEYAHLFTGDDLSLFAEEILKVICARPYYPEKKLHELALKKYIFERGLGYSKEECDSLERLCRFNGLNVDVPADILIGASIYSYGKSHEKRSTIPPACDGEILRGRNRYTLTMTLANHKKRASRHRWDAVIGIQTEENIPPLIKVIPIVERRAEICRNGVTLEKEKKTSQVLCAGEICIGDKVSPFELDLILDISHVSTTKCTHCEIKIERFKRQGEYLILQTDISLYDISITEKQ